jgi:hypothetical protein
LSHALVTFAVPLDGLVELLPVEFAGLVELPLVLFEVFAGLVEFPPVLFVVVFVLV